MERVSKKTPLNAITSTTVSEPISVRYAKRVTFSFKRTGHVSGSVVFKIQASLDGIDYVPSVNMISNDVNNHSQNVERNITVELTGNQHVLAALDLENFCYDYIQVSATESGTGTSTCKMVIVE